MPRPRLLACVLGITLVASAAAGWVLNRIDDTEPATDLSLETPGTYAEPLEGGIPTAPDLTGRRLPAINATTLDGTRVTLEDFVGQPLVLNIWFSSCVPCAKELPDFAEAHRRLGDRVRFVGLNIQDSAEVASEFAKRAGVGFEVILGAEGSVMRALDVRIFPSTLLVDAAGQIVDLHQGALDVAELTDLIDARLGVA